MKPLAKTDSEKKRSVIGRALVACEKSGVVRESLRRQGWDAWSCDIVSSEDDSPYHIHGNVLCHLLDDWDLLIAHPPCTHTAVSGARWFKYKKKEQEKAVRFFMDFVNVPIGYKCIEHPISIMSTVYRKPDQIIQPWQFGHGEVKATCLWLKNLPKLKPTKIVEGRLARVHRMPPGKNRASDRSRTLQGIADAMAIQFTRSIQYDQSY